MPDKILNVLKKFREKIYNFFHHRQDAAIELVDSLSSNISAKSIVQLSLNPLHRRNYCSITRVIDEFYSSKEEKKKQNLRLTSLFIQSCLPPQSRKYHLLALDSTPQPRKYSPTLKDRSYVYDAGNAVSGKPITIGHQYSCIVYLPEERVEKSPPWVIPLSCTRITSDKKGTLVGMEQMTSCITSSSLFKEELVVSVSDAAYNQPLCLWEAKKNTNQVHISRARSNRNFYYIHSSSESREKKRGRPKTYGEPHKLHDPKTWEKSDEYIELELENKRGEKIFIKIDRWNNLLMRGKRNCKLSDYPCNLLKVCSYKESGEPLFSRPLWITIFGKRRHELSTSEIFKSYRHRFDIEHFFRFGKQRLLLDKAQTPEADHEEAWWQLTMIAYNQLYLSRQLAHNKSNPWEKRLPEFKDVKVNKTPTQVQKSFSDIIREIGTPAKPAKVRNKSLGRQLGDIQKKRLRYVVVKKGKKAENSSQIQV